MTSTINETAYTNVTYSLMGWGLMEARQWLYYFCQLIIVLVTDNWITPLCQVAFWLSFLFFSFRIWCVLSPPLYLQLSRWCKVLLYCCSLRCTDSNCVVIKFKVVVWCSVLFDVLFCNLVVPLVQRFPCFSFMFCHE